jgi:phosphotransferase system enzyme I (PtsI)
MLTSVQEIRMVRVLLEESREELDARGLAYDPKMPLGGMIEVPAAALAIAELAPHLNFISVGTNDLLQYALAADRVDELVAHLYDPQHPGVVRLLRYIFREASASRIPVTVCGEVAGDRQYTRLLLALGLKDFSMHPGRLLEVKQAVRETDIPKARAALSHWFNTTPAESGRSLLQIIDDSQRTG